MAMDTKTSIAKVTVTTENAQMLTALRVGCLRCGLRSRLMRGTTSEVKPSEKIDIRQEDQVWIS